MYTNYFEFIENDENDFNYGSEQLDIILASHTGTIKHVTHAAVVVKEGIKHYYTIFLEQKA